MLLPTNGGGAAGVVSAAGTGTELADITACGTGRTLGATLRLVEISVFETLIFGSSTGACAQPKTVHPPFSA